MQLGVKEMPACPEAAFAGAAVEVADDGGCHRGHSGWRRSTRFRVCTASPDFAGLRSTARHRRVCHGRADTLAAQLRAHAAVFPGGVGGTFCLEAAVWLAGGTDRPAEHPPILCMALASMGCIRPSPACSRS